MFCELTKKDRWWKSVSKKLDAEARVAANERAQRLESEENQASSSPIAGIPRLRKGKKVLKAPQVEYVSPK